MKGTYEDAIFICNTLKSADFRAYLAGGCVRDILLGVDPSDYDITTSAPPDQVQRLFERTVPVGISFGVVKVVLGTGENVRELDVATFRKDGKYSDNRRPDEVEYTLSAEQDVKRRDFTINALLMDTDSKIVDYVGGQEDLKKRILRTVGRPEDRFDEDALRMLRALRFALKYNLTIDPLTFEAIKNNALEVRKVSKERVTDELTKMLTGGRAAMAFWLLHQSGLFDPLFNFLWVGQQDKWLLLESLDRVPGGSELSLPLAVLTVEMEEKDTDKILQALCLTTVQREGRSDIIKKAEVLKAFSRASLADQRRMMNWPNLEVYKAFLHCVKDRRGWSMIPQIGSYDLKRGMETVASMGFPDALINGNDLLSWGYHAGPVFTDMLHSVETQQLEGLICSAEGARVWIRDHFPAAKRSLECGTIIDGMSRRTYLAYCPTCRQPMSFTAECLADGKMNWDSIEDRQWVRVSRQAYYAHCTRPTNVRYNPTCDGRRSKHRFVETHI